MYTEELRLRPDLIISPQAGSGDSALVVKDPQSGRFFRFREVEGFILSSLNGTTSPETLQRSVQERFQVSLSRENVEQFLERVKGLGFLESGSLQSTPQPRSPKRIRGDLFYVRVKWLDPDRLLTSLNKTLGFVYTKSFLLFSVACFLLALGISIARWDEITLSLGTIFRNHSVFAAWVIVLLVITAHEFGHGLTCKRYGGSVHEMGFLLIYFMPAFYCNVSDSWLFPEKSKRCLVAFAGAYTELLIWSLATLAWRATEPNTFINFASLVVVATSGFKQLFNMNPLIKLDGYYILSDYLGIPNLRSRAFTYLRDIIKAFLGFSPGLMSNVKRRERRIYVLYGLLAAAYTSWLLGVAISNVGGYLVTTYQGYGFVFFTVLLVGLFRNRLGNLRRRLLSRVMANTQEHPVWMKRRTIFYAILVAGVIALFVVRMELRVAGEFVMLPAHNSDVRAGVEGIIEEINVEEGDVVKKGDVVARLSGRDNDAELRKITAAIDEKQAQVRLLKAGVRIEEIELAKTQIGKAEERLKYAQKNYDIEKALYEKNIQSKKEFQRTEELVAVTQKELEEARDHLKVLRAGNRPEQIEAAEAELRSLEAQRHYLEEQFRLLTVVSPNDGIITTHKPKEKLGQHVAKGDLIATVHDLRKITAEIAVPEKEIADVHPGQPVELKARSFPQESFSGTVIAVAPTATMHEAGGGERSISVTTEIDNRNLLLKSGMSGNAKILCGEHKAIELLTRRIVRFIRVEFWSWW